MINKIIRLQFDSKGERKASVQYGPLQTHVFVFDVHKGGMKKASIMSEFIQFGRSNYTLGNFCYCQEAFYVSQNCIKYAKEDNCLPSN